MIFQDSLHNPLRGSGSFVVAENISIAMCMPCGNALVVRTLNDKRKDTAGESLTILLTAISVCSNRSCHG